MAAIDLSPIRLNTSFAEAKQLLDPSISELNYHSPIQLSPYDKYVQITNLDGYIDVDSNPQGGISFDGNYAVYLIDCRENVLKDITTNVAIKEFTDTNGIPQIAYELINVGQDFYAKAVFLKFVHTVSDAVWYSTPFAISDYQSHYCTRVDYWSYGVFQETDYERAGVKCSIRVRAYYDGPQNETTSKGYDTTDNRRVSALSRTIRQKLFTWDYINPFTIDCFTYVLEHDVIYLDGVRCTSKPQLKYDERQGNSNRYSCTFVAPYDRKDTYTAGYQIYVPLTLISKIPTGEFSLDNVPIKIAGVFNKPINLLGDATHTLRLYDASDDSILATYTFPSALGSNGFQRALSAITTNGDYYIKIDEGFIEATNGEQFSITNKTDWAFSVRDGEFDGDEFDDSEFLTV